MSIKSIETFFSNLQDRSITVCEGCNENQVLSRKNASDLGYCFYRPHEGLYAAETGMLYLTWGAYTPDDLVMLIVVEAIKDEARACKLDVSWKGTLKDRVLLQNLDKRYFSKYG